mgnify:CR=1 FL=1
MWKFTSKKRNQYYKEVIRLHQEGLGYMRISHIIPVSEATIANWIRNFVKEKSSTVCMAKSHQAQITSPESASESTDVRFLRSEIARLKRQLAQESLRADAYNELINVAEKQFNIPIRKKAGAKQWRTCTVWTCVSQSCKGLYTTFSQQVVGKRYYLYNDLVRWEALCILLPVAHPWCLHEGNNRMERRSNT